MSAAILETEQLLRHLSRAEKAQLLQWIVQDLGDAFAGIEQLPGVSGGAACLIRTRIPVWVLVRSRQLGVTEAELLRAYPTIGATDLANAWAYARTHADEITGAIAENEHD